MNFIRIEDKDVLECVRAGIKLYKTNKNCELLLIPFDIELCGLCRLDIFVNIVDYIDYFGKKD